MSARLALRLARAIIRAVAVLVPGVARADWVREWHAELHHQSHHRSRQQPFTWRTHMALITRALGALPDAAWLRRQFTLDADAVHDAGHAVRMLVKTPGFTVIALLVFAVGIGAATAIVSIADALFMRPMAVTQPERVVTLWQHNRETGAGRLDVAPGNALDWMARARSFEAVAMAEPMRFNTNFAGREPDYVYAAIVGEQFFRVLGTPVLHGRSFLPQEYQRGGPRVVVMSHSMWASRYGSNPSIVGSSLRLDTGDAYTVVGVLPPGVELRPFDDRARRPEPMLWLPKQGFLPVEATLRTQAYWNVIARLRPGVSVAAAQAELTAISTQLASQYPQTNARISAEVVPLRAHLVGSLRDVLPMLIGAAAILLIVACANVASLLLARGASRGREFAVRQALGAHRFRLVRQMLVETLLLAAAGGVIGLVVARWVLDTIAALRPRDIALVDAIPIDARGAVIACGVTVVAALVSALMPAMQLSRPTAVLALREGRTSSRRGLRGALVILEIAAALILAVGAGLMVRSFISIQQVDPGFSRDQVSVLQLFATRRIDTAPKRVVFFQQALDRIRALPGVVAAGATTSMPFGEARVIVRVPFVVAGRPAASGEAAIAYTSAISGDYFGAMRVPLLGGRLFDATDSSSSRQVVLVSRSAARQFWGDADPVGSRLRFRFTGAGYDAEVVGVVGDVRHEGLDSPAAPEVYLPYAQSGFYGLTFVVRTAPGSPADLSALKEQIWAIDPLQPIFDTAHLDQLISKTLTAPRFHLFVLGGFALATLLLATAGVYGVMSFSTSQRTREFGVRLALGATGRDIVGLVVREGLALAGLGVILGVALALPLTRVLRTLLFGVTETDPMTFVVVSLVLAVAALAACYVPASRALRVDPGTGAAHRLTVRQ